MEERLREVLRGLGYSDNEIHLESAGSGKIVGHIVSDAFQGESQINRQNQLQAKLQGVMKPEELERVAVILTMTPLEVSD